MVWVPNFGQKHIGSVVGFQKSHQISLGQRIGIELNYIQKYLSDLLRGGWLGSFISAAWAQKSKSENISSLTPILSNLSKSNLVPTSQKWVGEPDRIALHYFTEQQHCNQFAFQCSAQCVIWWLCIVFIALRFNILHLSKDCIVKWTHCTHCAHCTV